MKLLILLNALLLAFFGSFALGFAIERPSLSARDDNNGTVSTPDGDIVSSFQSDGKYKVEFYNEGVLELTALEQDDGGKYVEADAKGRG